MSCYLIILLIDDFVNVITNENKIGNKIAIGFVFEFEFKMNFLINGRDAIIFNIA